MAVKPLGLAGAQLISGGIAGIYEGPEDASETYGKGAILIEGTGTLAEGAADLTSGIVGLSLQKASGTTNALVPYVPALEGLIFEGNLSTGGANPPTAYTLAINTDFLTRYALQIDTSQTTDQGTTITGVWYIDQADPTNVSITIMGFKDDVGTSDARVFFVINADTTVYAT